MLRIVLIRPGTTDYDNQGRIQGTLDIPLNDQGADQIDRTIAELSELNLDAIYCSASQPAQETAERIGEALQVRVKTLSNMRNLNHGLWQGMLVDDVRRKHPKVYRQWQDQPSCVCPPEGEMLDKASERVHAAMGRLLKKHKSGTIGLVLPGPLASLIRCYVAGCEPRNLWQPALDGEAWEIIELEPHDMAHAR